MVINLKILGAVDDQIAVVANNIQEIMVVSYKGKYRLQVVLVSGRLYFLVDDNGVYDYDTEADALVAKGLVDAEIEAALVTSADDVIFDGSGTNYLTAETEVEGALKELDTQVKANADILGVDVEQNKQDIENIEDGTTVVKKAEQDEDGNNIKDTYATVTYVDAEIGGSYTNINYTDLVELRDTSQLRPGAFYRIIDYETTTVQPETRSAGHLFDVIVQALDEKTLSENAFAINSPRDTSGYFSGKRLEAWKLKYTLDNDTSRFAWADEVNGKGVIYRMIDEFENDLPYDFKNIQFKRSDDYYFTFTWITEDDTIWDASIHPELTDDEGKGSRVFNNIIPLAEDYLYILNDNVFIADYDTEDGMFYGWSWNITGKYFVGNTFDDGCYNNTIGDNFSRNTVGMLFGRNTIGNNFTDNTIGDDFSSNTIRDYFYNNTIGEGFGHNTTGDFFNNNTIGDSCSRNTIGNTFFNNTIGNHLIHSTIGNSVQFIQFSSDGTFGNEIRYLHLKDGLSGASSANRLDLYYSGLQHRTYPTTFEVIANGNIVSSWEATPLTRTGKVKATNTTADWTDI